MSTTVDPQVSETSRPRPYEVVEEVGIKPEEAAKPQTKKSRRNRALAVIFLAVLALVIFLVFGFDRAGSRKRADVPVTTQTTPADQRAANDAQVSSDQAIASLKEQIQQPSSVAGAPKGQQPISTDPLAGNVNPLADPVYNPNAGIYQPSLPTPGATGEQASAGTANGSANSTGTSARESANTAITSSTPEPQRNGQSSIYFFDLSTATAETAAPVTASSVTTSRRGDRRSSEFTVDDSAPNAPVKPPFGTVLPVRLLGSIYTLRAGSLVRLELTRAMKGNGWALPRGTVFVGRLDGGQNDRAFVNLIGFIDAASNRLVALGGEALGIDGGTGFRGTRKRVGSRWAKALSQIANASLGLGSAYLSGRGNNGGGVIYSQPPSAVFGVSDAASNGNADFVAVTAGSLGYVMVSELPSRVEGVESPGTAETGGELSDDELMQLMTTGTPDEIRAALPRMNPRLRKIAEEALKSQ